MRLDDVETAIRELSTRYNHARVVVDPWQAVSMTQRLRATGITIKEFNFSTVSVGRLAVTLSQLVRNHELALPDDRELLDELARVQLRESSPGVVRMDHAAGQHDDRAIAIALAAVNLLERPAAKPLVFSLPLGFGIPRADPSPFGW